VALLALVACGEVPSPPTPSHSISPPATVTTSPLPVPASRAVSTFPPSATSVPPTVVPSTPTPPVVTTPPTATATPIGSASPVASRPTTIPNPSMIPNPSSGVVAPPTEHPSHAAVPLIVTPTGERTCPENAPIKGKTSNGRALYYLPGVGTYDKTEPD